MNRSAVVGCLDGRDAAISVFLRLAGKDVLVAVAKLLKRPVNVTAHTGHLDVLAGLALAQQRELAIRDIRKNDVAVAQVTVLVQLVLQLGE